MPSTWAPEALKAQAVAARSYALATKKVGAPFDAYADTRSQMYLGISNESSATTGRRSMPPRGRCSSTEAGSRRRSSTRRPAGRRSRVRTGWAGRCRTSSPCRIRYDGISPYHDWGPMPVTAKAIVKALKVTGPIVDATTTPNPSGRVGELSLVTPATSVEVPATELARRNWAPLDLVHTRSHVARAAVAELAASVRRPGDAVRDDSRRHGRNARTADVRRHVADRRPGHPGAVKLTQKPAVTTDYRLRRRWRRPPTCGSASPHSSGSHHSRRHS